MGNVWSNRNKNTSSWFQLRNFYYFFYLSFRLSKKKINKKGLLGNLIGGFLVILIGFTLIPTIAQQVNLAINCNSTNYINYTIEQTNTGSTNSFGGGGSEHFGGYTNEVSHKNFYEEIGKYSIIQTNSSIINPECNKLSSGAETMVGLVSIFFALAIATLAIGLAFIGFKNTGIVWLWKLKEKYFIYHFITI